MFEAVQAENRGHWLQALYERSSIYHLGAVVGKVKYRFKELFELTLETTTG